MKWNIKPKAPGAFFEQFSEFSSLVVQLLYNRGLKTRKEIDKFFNPDYQTDLHDPFLLKGMKKAVNRISKAIKKQERIVIYGDFDTDGVCATAVVYLTLKELGLKNLDIYIPNREKENHGLNGNSVKGLAKKKTDLIIAVDCASTDLKEAKLVKELGMDLIITDHHQTSKRLPETVAFVNPWQKGDKYPFKDLSGAGVAYKLVCALLSLVEELHSSKIEECNSSNFKKWLLDLAALATVADMMPIINENRTIVKYGLGVLAQTRWIGLQELMKSAQLEPQVISCSNNGQAPRTNLDCYTFGFILGPRLNAAGRVDHANIAFELLVSQNREEAKELSEKINQRNLLRQQLTSKIVKQVEERLADNFSQNKDLKVIFEGSPDWPIGLVGLIAGKIADKYCRPAVIYHQKGDLIHASCRGVPKFNLIEVLNKYADLFDDYGGHKRSAGFRIKADKLDKIKEAFAREAEDRLKKDDLTAYLDIDAELSLPDINLQNYNQLQMFQPFGRSNSQPRFLAKGLEISSLRAVGNGNNHLKMELVMFDNNKAKKFNAIAFGFGNKGELLKPGQSIDVVFEMIINQWNGRHDLEMKIIDLKLSN